MRLHPVIGERILSAVPGLEQVARAVRHEHERWDGDGYPDGLAGDAIPLASRIVLACDAWHALVSDRPYRKALDHEAALAELRRCAGTQFDPGVVAALLESVTAPRGAAVLGARRRCRRRARQHLPGQPGARAGRPDLRRDGGRRGAPHRRRARGRGRGGARRDRSLDAVDRALPPRQRHRPDADQRRRAGADRAAPPRRRDLPARGRRRDAHRDQGRRHALRLARRPRPAGHRARAAAWSSASTAASPCRSCTARRSGGRSGRAAPRTARRSTPATRASCTRSPSRSAERSGAPRRSRRSRRWRAATA